MNKGLAVLVTNFFLVVLTALCSKLSAQSTVQSDAGVSGFYRVFNLVPGDTLNVRGKPSSKSKILGRYEQGKLVYATGRTSSHGRTRWSELNWDGILGWVSSSYLQLQKILNFPNSRAPREGTCGGFEPGWNLRWNERSMSFEDSWGKQRRATFQSSLQPRGHSQPDVLVFKNTNSGSIYKLILRESHELLGCELAGEQHSKLYDGLLFVERDTSLDIYMGCCNPSSSVIVPSN